MGETEQTIEIVIITGMSGAGKTVAVQSFEDLGYFCVDNLPPALLPKFIDLIEGASGKMNKVALVMDLRGQRFFDHLFEAVDQLSNSHMKPAVQILFLESKDNKLVQ